MKRSDLNRRDFGKLTAAAFSGLVAGTTLGCGNGDQPAADPDGEAPAEPKIDSAALLSEPHVCRGLNACTSKGAGKENACAGQGTCATAVAHTCHKENDCKGQGGCGEFPGQNACKGQGDCAVPLGEKSWEKARAKFTELMEADGKTVGEAPAKA